MYHIIAVDYRQLVWSARNATNKNSIPICTLRFTNGCIESWERNIWKYLQVFVLADAFTIKQHFFNNKEKITREDWKPGNYTNLKISTNNTNAHLCLPNTEYSVLLRKAKSKI